MKDQNLKLKKGDTVKLLVGKDRGKQGKILQVFPSLNRVAVEGLNMMTKHLKKSGRRGEKGQKVRYPSPVNASNAMLVCPKCQKPTRVKHQVLTDKGKVRICRRCQEAIK